MSKKIIVLTAFLLILGFLMPAGFQSNYSQSGQNLKLYEAQAKKKKNKKKSKNPKRINDANSWCPTFSPDGKYIVYRNESDNGRMYRKNANDTSNGSPITNNTNTLYPSYSPDGRYIIYNTRTGFGDEIFKKNADDSSDGDVIIEDCQRAIYSPNGNYILYDRSLGDGTRGYFLKNANDNSIGDRIQNIDGLYPTFSPDGRYVISSRAGSLNLYRTILGDSSGSEAINHKFGSLHPAYSPNGKKIAYTASCYLYQKNTNSKDNGKNVLAGKQSNCGYFPVYSPNSKYLIYENGKDHRLYQLKL